MVEKERLCENELHDVEFLVFSRLRLLFQRVKITPKSGVQACPKNYPHFRSNFSSRVVFTPQFWSKLTPKTSVRNRQYCQTTKFYKEWETCRRVTAN